MKLILNFDRITAFRTLILRILLHSRVCSVCNQFLLQLSMDLLETMHICYAHNENVHVDI